MNDERAELIKLIESTLTGLADLAPKVCPKCGGTAVYLDDVPLVYGRCLRCAYILRWDQFSKKVEPI